MDDESDALQMTQAALESMKMILVVESVHGGGSLFGRYKDIWDDNLLLFLTSCLRYDGS